MRRCLLYLSLFAPACLLAQENDTPSPFQEGSTFASELTSMLLTLSLILIFLVLGAWALRRMMATRVQQLNESSSIKILERRTLAPKIAVYLLDVAGTGIVISESTNGVQLLTTLPEGTDLSELGLGDSPEELAHPMREPVS